MSGNAHDAQPLADEVGAQPLAGHVALVAGATRGAGRGIARALGEAGAIVYCTGRSVAGAPSPYGRPETIEQTAQMIGASGGTAIAIRVDHTVEVEVEALFERIDAEHGRVDILVNCIAGEDPLIREWGYFWDTNFENGTAVFRQCLLSHLITAKHAARRMIRAKRGLIVEVTEGDMLAVGGNPMAHSVKSAHRSFVLGMAAELERHGVAAIAITPGFLRSESMLEHFGVTEATWREAGRKDGNFLESESPLFVGRAIAALAADPNLLARTGELVSSWQCAREYGFNDYDGRRPDWGNLAVDFSTLPAEMVEVLETGTEIQLRWLEAVLKRTREWYAKMP
jgi:NAD(P)-dependent dehydrogenase (short-subunit alcohol dehydrogenase family)